MKNILQAIECKDLHYRKIDGFRKLTAALDTKAMKQGYDFNIGIKDQYRLTLTLALDFNADSLSFGKAKNHAEHKMLDFIYGDIIKVLFDIKSAIYDGDAEETDQLVSELIKSLRHPS